MEQPKLSPENCIYFSGGYDLGMMEKMLFSKNMGYKIKTCFGGLKLNTKTNAGYGQLKSVSP